jgi:DNA-binding HxlR family transcriptional regulator
MFGRHWREMVFFGSSGALLRKKRFGELKNNICAISSKSLTQTLRHLEENGIVVRKAFATIPPTVEYDLTEKGHTLHNIIHEMKAWGAHWA